MATDYRFAAKEFADMMGSFAELEAEVPALPQASRDAITHYFPALIATLQRTLSAAKKAKA